MEFAANSPRPAGASGIKLDPLKVAAHAERVHEYGSISVDFARARAPSRRITVRGPDGAPPKSA